jgi:hypothetical protein
MAAADRQPSAGRRRRQTAAATSPSKVARSTGTSSFVLPLVGAPADSPSAEANDGSSPSSARDSGCGSPGAGSAPLAGFAPLGAAGRAGAPRPADVASSTRVSASGPASRRTRAASAGGNGVRPPALPLSLSPELVGKLSKYCAMAATSLGGGAGAAPAGGDVPSPSSTAAAVPTARTMLRPTGVATALT